MTTEGIQIEKVILGMTESWAYLSGQSTEVGLEEEIDNTRQRDDN